MLDKANIYYQETLYPIMAQLNASRQVTQSEILDVLVQGCDERIYIQPETERNKYYLNPVQYDDFLQRGSCTANVLTPRAAEVASAFGCSRA